MDKAMLTECVRYALRKVDRHPSPYRHFSFVFNDRDELLGVGINRHGDAGPYRFGAVHAEYFAIQKALQRVGRHGFSCVNLRIGNDMNIRMSAPCSICRRLLEISGCTDVIYSIDNRQWGEIKF